MRLSGPVKRAASGKQSAGLLLYRLTSGDPEVLLGLPSGPFCRKKDLASWSIPKGLIAEGEPPLVAAKREFNEKTGYTARAVKHCRLAKPGSLEARPFTCGRWNDWDPAGLQSNMFEMEWPPRSGRR